ncbi:MAG TPA: PASTA domain-containing protein [Candidatus Aquilonibacter sp.]|nr:PASTA domain-containing protein [Candidatus Aquilonibacter sp.]
MSFKERVQWLARMALMLFVLASITFLSAIIAMRYAIVGREVTLPNLVGKSQLQSEQMLSSIGVTLRVEDRVFSDLPVGAVVRQSPPPAMRVKEGSEEHVVLSLGMQKVTIPALDGMSDRLARIELLRNGMQLGEETTVYLPGAPADTVIDQSPEPGTTNATSPHENILVAAEAPAPAYVMPELNGMNFNAAEAKLATAGLKVSKVTMEEAPGAEHGIVLDQTPSRGARVDATVPIELQVSE